MLAPATRLGPYEIVAPLGKGGMGEVYRARDTRLGREVALKLLPPQFAADPVRLARFQIEARAVAALAHPNILVLYDVGTAAGTPFVVTELLEGETLRERLGRTPLAWRKAIEFAAAVADGLAAAHARGIVHRDVKPDNVFVTADERVKVLDFGLAKVGPAAGPDDPTTRPYSPTPTEDGVVMGTAPYMSPEQLRGEAVDARSDLFSFGCVLYEMLAGHRPFAGRTNAELVGAILRDDPPALAEKSIPPELQRLVRRCLEKNPEARFQSARDLAFALRSAAADSGQVDVRLAGRSRRRPWLVGAAVAVLLAAGGVYFATRPRPPDTVRPDEGKPADAIAVLPFVYAGKDAELEYLADMIPGTLIKSLSEVKELRVRPMSSVAGYGGKRKGLNLRDVGRELAVRAVVTGTVQPRTDGLLVGVELVDVADNRVLWSEQYDRPLADLQVTQAEIARTICGKLDVTVSGQEERRLAKRYTENAEAYLLYLEARHWIDKWSTEGTKKAIDCLDRTLALDPNNALAHGARAEAYIGACYDYLRPLEGFPIAKRAAERAVQLDPELPNAHKALGVVLCHSDWDWVGAGRAFRRALQLNPRMADTHDWYGWYLICLGRTGEAVESLRTAVELEPRSVVYNAELTWALYFARDYAAAKQQAEATLKLDPNDVNTLDVMCHTYANLRNFPEAIAAAERIKTTEETLGIAMLGHMYARAGKRDRALTCLEDLDRLSKNRYIRADWWSFIYTPLGETDKALDWLEKAADERSPGLTTLRSDPRYDPLRSHPRFRAILKKMNLPP